MINTPEQIFVMTLHVSNAIQQKVRTIPPSTQRCMLFLWEKAAFPGCIQLVFNHQKNNCMMVGAALNTSPR